jgi:hypothetical protein
VSTRRVLFIDGPLEGQVHEVAGPMEVLEVFDAAADGREAERIAPFTEYRRRTYEIRTLLLFGRAVTLGAVDGWDDSKLFAWLVSPVAMDAAADAVRETGTLLVGGKTFYECAHSDGPMANPCQLGCHWRLTTLTRVCVT